VRESAAKASALCSRPLRSIGLTGSAISQVRAGARRSLRHVNSLKPPLAPSWTMKQVVRHEARSGPGSRNRGCRSRLRSLTRRRPALVRNREALPSAAITRLAASLPAARRTPRTRSASITRPRGWPGRSGSRTGPALGDSHASSRCLGHQQAGRWAPIGSSTREQVRGH